MIPIAAQVRAINHELANPRQPLRAMPAERTQPKPPPAPRRNDDRIARANGYRVLALQAMTRRDTITIPQLRAAHPQIANGSWVWLFISMTEAGFIEVRRHGFRNTAYYGITRKGLAELERLAPTDRGVEAND